MRGQLGFFDVDERLKRLSGLGELNSPGLDPGRGRTRTGQFWAYGRDDRA